MPSSNGVYSLPPGYLAVTGATIQASQHNPPLEDIAAALTLRLSRDGSAPMLGPLQLTVGTAAAPGAVFATDASSGLYKTTNGIGVAIGGAQVAEFTAAGLATGITSASLLNLVNTAALQDKSVTQPKLFHPSAAARLLGSNANAALAITGAASNGGPNLVRLTVASTAAFATSQKKTVSDVVGTTEANGLWTITVVDATHIDLQGSVFTNAWVSGGTIGGGVDEIKLGSGLSWLGDTISASLAPALIPNYISGLILSTAGGSGTFGISAGAANDSTNVSLMLLASAYTKTTASWALGTGNGGLDTGAIANATWYHVFEIQRPDTGVVDVLFSLSPTSPTMPTNYTLFRRIGSMKTDGSGHWLAFTQVVDTFIWTAAVLDVNGIALVASRVNKVLSTPTGVVTAALFRAAMNVSANSAIIFASLLENDAVPVSGVEADLTSASGLAGGAFERLTDVSAQIGVHAANTSGTYSIFTYGWKDTRGK